MKKLLTLFTLLLCVCSGAWGQTYTSTDPKTITFDGTYGNKTFLDVTGTNSNATIESSGETCLAYNVYYLESLETKPSWFTPSAKGYSSSAAAYTDAENYGFLTTTDASSKDVATNSKGYGHVTVYNQIDGDVLAFNVTGITGVSVLGKDNGTSSNKQFSINIKEVASDGSLSNVGETASTGNTTFHIVSYDGNATGNATLDASKYYIVTIYAKTKNSNYIAQISFTKPSAPAGPTISSFSPVSGKNVKTGAEITINGTSGSTIYYAWATSAQTADAIYNSGSGNHGTADAGTATTTVEEGKTLYAIARKDNTNSAVASATYTIDETAPTLSSSTPVNSATGVVLSGNIVLTFSENVSINDASKFTLTGGAGTLNTASATVSGAAVTIPYSGLASGTAYTFSTAAGAVKDEAGNTNAALSDISFTSLADETAPTLSDSNPADGATGITSAVNVTLTFSENVVLTGDFTLTPSGATVGTPTVSDATITIPIKGMSYGTTYTLGLAKEDLEDEAGNALAADLSIGFTTMATPATTKTWNFKTALSDTDKTNLAADDTNWTDDYNDHKRFNSKVNFSTLGVLMANDNPIEKTAGLLFTGNAGRIRIADDYVMNNTSVPMTIPNLKAGDEVTVVFSTGSDGNSRSISVSNASLVYGTESSSVLAEDDATAVYKVSADGNVAISSANNFMRYYSVTVATNSNNAVTVSSAAYATIVTTGNVDFSKTPDVTAYKASINGTSLVLSEVTAAPANTPLIIAADAAAYVLAITTDTPSAVEDNDLQAANTDITQDDATDGKTIYVLNKVDDTVGFYKLSATGTLKAGKAYVELDSTTDASALNFFINDEQETDGIKAVNESEFKFKEGIYDMQGRKVVRPTKGLYIVNGKKVVIK